jgi:hypothetical protein
VLQHFKRNQVQHAMAVSQWMRKHGAKGGLDPLNMVMEISANHRTHRFYPQFTVMTPEGVRYVDQFAPGISGFVGWYPYTRKYWKEAFSKLAFKRYANTVSLRTPAWSLDNVQLRGAYLIKNDESSFGQGQRGPFMADRTSEVVGIDGRTLGAGEFYEQFIVGQLMKAWFWNNKPAAIEVIEMPHIVGDGVSSILELYRVLTKSVDRPLSEHLLTVQGVMASQVIPTGKKVIVEYQHAAETSPVHYADYNCLNRVRGTAFEKQLIQGVDLCLATIPSEERQGGVLMTLDGVIDREGKVWFLEMNSNPQLHPAFYDTLLDDLFQVDQPATHPEISA